MKVIIAGGRDFKDFELLCKVCDYMLSKQKDVTIVSGTCKGADQLGERYAELRGYKIIRYKPDWDKLGKVAGLKRNEIMANNADALIAFWNGSRGTANMIENAKKMNLKIKVQRY